MKTFDSVVLLVLVAAAFLAVLRIIRQSGLGDRAVAFDLLTTIITCSLIVSAARTDDGLPLDLAILLGLLGFLTAVTVARFIETREREQ